MVKFMASFFPNHSQARGAGALLVAAFALALVCATPAGADSAFSLHDQQKFEDLAGSFLEAAPTNPLLVFCTPHTKGSWLGTSQDIKSILSAQEFLDIEDFRIRPPAIGRKQNSTVPAQDRTWLRSWKPLSPAWRRPHHTGLQVPPKFERRGRNIFLMHIATSSSEPTQLETPERPGPLAVQESPIGFPGGHFESFQPFFANTMCSNSMRKGFSLHLCILANSKVYQDLTDDTREQERGNVRVGPSGCTGEGLPIPQHARAGMASTENKGISNTHINGHTEAKTFSPPSTVRAHARTHLHPTTRGFGVSGTTPLSTSMQFRLITVKDCENILYFCMFDGGDRHTHHALETGRCILPNAF